MVKDNITLRKNQQKLLLYILILSFSLMKFADSLKLVRAINHQHHHRHNHNRDLFDSYRSFKTPNNTKIIAQLGSSAILPCSLEGLTSDTITWIRKTDYKLLTGEENLLLHRSHVELLANGTRHSTMMQFSVNRITHSSDERFHVEHLRHRGVWNLQINSILETDEATYICQLNTHPPQSIHIHLTVLKPIAEIHESPEINISEGSVLKLECKIVNAIENPAFIFW